MMKLIFTFYQFVTESFHAEAAPDQPIKASMTYWLVRRSLSMKALTTLCELFGGQACS